MNEKLTQIVESLLPDESYFIVEIAIRKSRVMDTVSVLIDSDEGIGIDECADVSRKLGKILEDENLFENAYELEVASPGVGEPLQLKRQYFKNKDRFVAIKLNDGSIKEGQMTQVSDESIEISPEIKRKPGAKIGKNAKAPEPFKIAFADIKETIVQVRF
jgi:ribosome maturation factor RimP